MNGDTVAALALVLGSAVLIGSSLVARRIPIGTTAKLAVAWVAVFAVVYVAFLYRGVAGDAWRRAVADVRGESDMEIAGRTLKLRKSDDGHFWADARVNGQRVRFLVDSGATVTTISAKSASEAGVVGGDRPAIRVSTGNGEIMVERGRIATLAIGPITQNNTSVHITDADRINVLGMSFLSRVRRWQVEGDVMTITS